MDTGDPYIVGTLANNIDDLSLTKQLPFRAQTAKPVLKYSSSEPGPIYLYQNSDLPVSQKVSSVPSSPSHTVADSRKTDGSLKSQYGSKPPKQPTTTQYSFAPTVDPYARPLSAKSLMTVGIDRPKSSSAGNGSKTSSTDITSHMHSTNLCNSNIFNTYDTSPQSVPKITRPHKTNASSSMTTTKIISIQSPSSGGTQTAKEKFEASLQRPSTARHGMRPPSALRMPLPSQIRNPNYSPAKPYQEVANRNNDEFKMVSDPKPNKEPDTLNNRVAKAITNLSRSKTDASAEQTSNKESEEPTESERADILTSESPSAQRNIPTSAGSTSTPVGSADSRRSSTSSNYYL